MAEDEVMAFDKAELSAVFRAFRQMDAEAVNQAKVQSGALAEYLQSKIRITAALS